MTVTGANAAKAQEATRPAKGVDPRHPARGTCEVVDAEAGVVAERGPDGEPRRSIAICGFATSSRHLCPFDDPRVSVWGVNQLYRHIPRADRWFEIHRNWREETVEGTDYVADLNALGVPVYMVERPGEIDLAVRYPVERLMERFGVDYFTSTIAFMLALAIDEVDQAVEAQLRDAPPNGMATAYDVLALARSMYAEHTIGVYGVDLIVGGEYFHEKPCAEMWIGMASARGIRVVLPPQSALCRQTHRYGYERAPEQWPISRSEIEDQRAELEKTKRELHAKLAGVEGALILNEYYEGRADIRMRGGGG